MNRSLVVAIGISVFVLSNLISSSASEVEAGLIYETLVSRGISPEIAGQASGRIALNMESANSSQAAYDLIYEALIHCYKRQSNQVDYVKIAQVSMFAGEKVAKVSLLPKGSQSSPNGLGHDRGGGVEPTTGGEKRNISPIASKYSPNLYFHAGSYLYNPYSYSYGTDTTGQRTATMDGDGVKASFYIEFVFNELWIISEERYSGLCPGHDQVFPVPKPLDFQARIAYVTASQEDSASTMVGSGDFAAEFSVGYHLWRMRSLLNKTHSVGLTGAYGAVSDRSVFDVHHRAFLGLSYLSGFVLNENQGYINLRFGAANIESVAFQNRDSRYLKLENDRVDYQSNWGPAIEAEAMIPIIGDSFITLGARAYGNSDANQVSMWIGYTHKLLGFDFREKKEKK